MYLLFFALGGAAVLAFLYCAHRLELRRLFHNPYADFSVPGSIPKGTFERLREGLEQMFPAAPAQSYIALSAFNPNPYDVEETKFFIRSAGKRGGVHRFRGELRLSTHDRHHIMDALPFLEQIGGPVERIDKSYGLVVLKTAKLDRVDGLVDVAEAFSKRVLACESDDDPIYLQWHIAGHYASNP